MGSVVESVEGRGLLVLVALAAEEELEADGVPGVADVAERTAADGRRRVAARGAEVVAVRLERRCPCPRPRRRRRSRSPRTCPRARARPRRRWRPVAATGWSVTVSAQVCSLGERDGLLEALVAVAVTTTVCGPGATSPAKAPSPLTHAVDVDRCPCRRWCGTCMCAGGRRRDEVDGASREPAATSTVCASATPRSCAPRIVCVPGGQVAFPGRGADVDPVDDHPQRLGAAGVDDDVALCRLRRERGVDDGLAVGRDVGVADERARSPPW